MRPPRPPALDHRKPLPPPPWNRPPVLTYEPFIGPVEAGRERPNVPVWRDPLTGAVVKPPARQGPAAPPASPASAVSAPPPAAQARGSAPRAKPAVSPRRAARSANTTPKQARRTAPVAAAALKSTRQPSTPRAPARSASPSRTTGTGSPPTTRKTEAGGNPSSPPSIRGAQPRSQSPSPTANPPTEAQPGPTAAQRGRYLFNNWHRSTFENRTRSVIYHLREHGKGRTAYDYTLAAQQFFAQHAGLRSSVVLRDGSAGYRVGSRKRGGYWTTSGRVVSFWER